MTQFTGAKAQIYYQNTSWTSAITDVSVATQSKAQSLIGIMDTALDNLTALRSTLGAEQNRLESSANVNVIGSQKDN